jgi:hypothetical protein
LKDAIGLGRPFLANAEVVIDLKDAKLMFPFGEDQVSFDMRHKNPAHLPHCQVSPLI